MTDVAEVKDEVKKDEAAPEPSAQIAGALSVFPGSPSKDQIEQWKGKFGEVFCSGFSETELFIFHPVGRQEFVSMQLEAGASQVPLNPFDMEEKLVRSCLLWASALGEKALVNKGGSMATLHEQIMANSNFIAPQLAQQLVIRL